MIVTFFGFIYTMKPMDPPQRSAKEVGDKFAQEYYSVLQDLHDFLDDFYDDDCTISRPGPDGKMIEFTILEGMKKKNLNVLSSAKEIVTNVVVDGQFASKEGLEEEKFTQTFYVALKGERSFVYYIKFCLVEEAKDVNLVSKEKKDANFKMDQVITTQTDHYQNLQKQIQEVMDAQDNHYKNLKHNMEEMKSQINSLSAKHDGVGSEENTD
ncbi:unnamed protein product [Cochlearia groenlandica]